MEESGNVVLVVVVGTRGRCRNWLDWQSFFFFSFWNGSEPVHLLPHILSSCPTLLSHVTPLTPVRESVIPPHLTCACAQVHLDTRTAVIQVLCIYNSSSSSSEQIPPVCSSSAALLRVDPRTKRRQAFVAGCEALSPVDT